MSRSLTLVYTCNVEARYRGFLTSVMLEIAPGLYVSPSMTAGVRDRVWAVLKNWYETLGNGSITLVVRDNSRTGSLRIESLGIPPKEIVDADGILLVKRK